MNCKIVMKNLLIFLLLVLTPGVDLKAQYIPAFKTQSPVNRNPHDRYWHKGNLFRHLEVSLSAGTTGIGIDLATTITEHIQIRAGYDYMPRFRKNFKLDVVVNGETAKQYDGNGNRIEAPFDRISEVMYQKTGYDLNDYVELTGKLTINNFKFLVDVYPFRYNKHWHFTAGAYWGPSQFGEAENVRESNTTLMLIGHYNQLYDTDEAYKKEGRLAMYVGDYSHDVVRESEIIHAKNDKYLMEPGSDGMIHLKATSNYVKPYVGFGYGGMLLPSRTDWKVTVEAGVLIWGGTPSQVTHDGTDLSRDVKNYKGDLKGTVDLIEKLKVFPVLSVRIAKTLF